jgi:hypothetical protein
MMFRSIAAGEQQDPAALATRLLWLQVPTAILGTLAQTATTLYVSFGVALLFFDIKARREGADLESLLEELEQRGSPSEAEAR